MSKPKGWRKASKKFLQPPNNDCMAAVGWTVSLEYWEQKEKGTWEACAHGEMSQTEEARNHYVSRRADLRPVRAMRKELDAFEEYMLKAITEADEYNKAFKESDNAKS